MTSKELHFMTTLTYADQLSDNPLIDFLNKISKMWIFAHEDGENGDNPHIHIYYITNRYSQTDTATRAFKKLYTDKFLKSLSTTRHLIVTKNPTTPKDKKVLFEYTVKYAKSTKDITFSGYDEKKLDSIFKKLDIKNLDKDYIKLSLLKAPLKLHTIMPMNIPIDYDSVHHYLGVLMAQQQLITHHLIDENTIGKIISGVNFLRLKCYKKKSN